MLRTTVTVNEMKSLNKKTMVQMVQILTFLLFLGFNVVISKPIFGNLYEHQTLNERIEQQRLTHKVCICAREQKFKQ